MHGYDHHSVTSLGRGVFQQPRAFVFVSLPPFFFSLCLFLSLFSYNALGDEVSTGVSLKKGHKINVARLDRTPKKKSQRIPLRQNQKTKVKKGMRQTQVLGQKDRAFCLEKSGYLKSKHLNRQKKISQAYAQFKRDQETSPTVRADIALILVCDAKHIAHFLLRKKGFLNANEDQLLKAFVGDETTDRALETTTTKVRKTPSVLEERSVGGRVQERRTAPTEVAQPYGLNPGDVKAGTNMPSVSHCLFSDLDVQRAPNLRRSHPVSPCPAQCLPKPAYLNQAQRDKVKALYGISWCSACLTLKRYMSPEEMEHIEKAGAIKLCPKQQIKPIDVHSLSAADYAGKVRHFFAPDSPAKMPHNHLGVIVSQQSFKQPRLKLERAHIQARAMRMTMTERLGYVFENIIEKRDLTTVGLKRFFGANSKRGDLQKHIHRHKVEHVTLYMTGLGAMDKEVRQAFVLGTDSRTENIARTSLKLAELLNVLEQLPVVSVTLILDMGFHAPDDQLVVSPNKPVFKAQVLPQTPKSKLTIVTAAKQDQHLLIDRDTGIGLFTKHLITALTGGADKPPFGNENGVVDMKEAYIYAAQKTRTSSVKSFGVFQNPEASFATAVTP